MQPTNPQNLEAQALNLNAWQRVAVATNDIVTPANALDAVAFGLAINGIRHLDSWAGIGKSALAYGADLVDGHIARSTGTSSPTGEIVDAGGDKIKLAAAIYFTWKDRLAPRPLLAAVAAQNIANTALTAYDRKKHAEPQIHASIAGKQTIFLQCMGIAMYVIGEKLAETHPLPGKTFKVAGNILGWAGIMKGFLQATPGYFREATRPEPAETSVSHYPNWPNPLVRRA